MKRPLVTFALWLVLLLVADQLLAWAYSFLYFPLIDPANRSIQYGSPVPDLILLSALILCFVAAGAIIAWRMEGAPLSVAAGMALGSVWLAVQIGISMPWFQLMPAHPTNYDHLMAFIGAASAPMAGALGAYLQCYIRGRAGGERNAT